MAAVQDSQHEIEAAHVGSRGVARSTRLLLALAALLYPGWHLVFRALLPDPVDPLWERLVVTCACLAALGLTYSPRWPRLTVPATYTVNYLATLHYLSLVMRNDFHTTYELGAYVVIASITPMFFSGRALIAYAATNLIAITASALLWRTGRRPPWEYVLGSATVQIAVGVGTWRYLQLRDWTRVRLAHHRDFLRNVIDAVPDPVFVRSSRGRWLLRNQAFERAFDEGDARARGVMNQLVAQERRLDVPDAEHEEDVQLPDRDGVPRTLAAKLARRHLASGGAVIVGGLRDVTGRSALEKALKEKIAALESAQARVQTLTGLLPICMHCSRIRDASDQWTELETYVEQRSTASFTHGICPTCLARHYPE